jgi:hypothetical protein
MTSYFSLLLYIDSSSPHHPILFPQSEKEVLAKREAESREALAAERKKLVELEERIRRKVLVV